MENKNSGEILKEFEKEFKTEEYFNAAGMKLRKDKMKGVKNILLLLGGFALSFFAILLIYLMILKIRC